MPYSKTSELPDSVKGSLPPAAQDIYLKAFNAAWDQYADPEERRGDDTREATAHKVAWSAVKDQYEKRDGKWVKQ